MRKHCGSFYETTNKQWREQTELPDTETRITQAYFIKEEINKELDTIIAGQRGPIADLIASWKAAEQTIPQGITSLLQLAFSMENETDICGQIGWMNRYRIPAPLSIFVQGDPRNHQRCRVYIESGDPRIGVPEYWSWARYTGHRKAYARYVSSLASTLGLPLLRKGYGAEREFSHLYFAREDDTHTLTWSELTKFNAIDWTTMLTAWGLQASELPKLTFRVSSSAFLHHLQSRMGSWPIQRWQGWFGLILAQWIAGCSPQGPLRSAWFAYSRKFLRGMPVDEKAEHLRNDIVRVMMPNTLGRLWTSKYCDPSLMRVRSMIQNIQAAAKKQLAATPWLSPATCKTAIRKLNKMDIQVCWPEKWAEETVCLRPDNLIENLLSIGKLATDSNQKLLRSGCSRPSEGWDRPVYVVNAYYYPSENRFVLPAAILRPPFYDPAKSLAWNYGSIGATIGHEICHAFDSDGRNYDEEGDRRDWWSDHDDREYKKRARQMVRLYETVPYRGMKVDGEQTLVENIADLGGLHFALEGLRIAIGKPLSRDQIREFFISFSVSWRSKDRLKRAAELIATDMHSPPMLRVNHVVRQMDEWYDAFDIGPDCAEWIAPDKRIRFFGP
jgi:predicted metalloendopeptidase